MTTFISIDPYIINDICEFNGDSKDIYSLITTCKELFERYCEMPIYLPNELSLFLFEEKLNVLDIENPFIVLAILEDLSWFGQITQREITGKLMNNEITMSTFIENEIDMNVVMHLKQSRNVIQRRFEFVAEYHPLLLWIMKNFRVDISNLNGPIEVENLKDIMTNVAYFKSASQLQNIPSISAEVAEVVGPYLGTCVYSLLLPETYIEIIKDSLPNEKIILGNNVWKYVVLSDPPQLRFAMNHCNFKPLDLTIEERTSVACRYPKLFQLVNCDATISVQFAVNVLHQNPNVYIGLSKIMKQQKKIAELVPYLVNKCRMLINHVPPDQRSSYLEVVTAHVWIPNFPLKSAEARKILATNHLQPGVNIKNILNACVNGKNDLKLKAIFEERGFLDHWIARFEAPCEYIKSPVAKRRKFNPQDV
jgi:hypothetical protein